MKGIFTTGLTALAMLASSQTQAAEVDIDALAQQGVERLSKYLQIDTINPPGNETRGVEYLSGLLDQAGIEYETGESAPGRGNLWAKIPAGSERKEPGLVLLHHIDVVPANRDYWSFDPLSGEVKDGFVYGRGAIDTKGLGIAQLQAFIALHASGVELNRDVWLIATADEEAGGYMGADWLIKTHPEIFADVGYVLNEGGSARRFGDTVAVMAEVTQKIPLWLKLTARGRPGHGSAPLVETSVTKMVRALKRIAETEFPVRVLEPVAQMFEGVAPFVNEQDQEVFAALGNANLGNEYLTSLKLRNPGYHALLRNTCSITRLEGSSKINVIPAEVHAELDCRLLPDQNPDDFLAELNTIINDDGITIEKIMGFTPAVSKTSTPLWRVLQEIAREYYQAELIPTVAGGFTDSHFFRDLGITSYGWSPFIFSTGEFAGVHGNDERVSTYNVVTGVKIYYSLLQRFAVE